MAGVHLSASAKVSPAFRNTALQRNIKNYRYSETKGHSQRLLSQIYQALIALLVSNGLVVESSIFKTTFIKLLNNISWLEKERGSQFKTS